LSAGARRDHREYRALKPLVKAKWKTVHINAPSQQSSVPCCRATCHVATIIAAVHGTSVCQCIQTCTNCRAFVGLRTQRHSRLLDAYVRCFSYRSTHLYAYMQPVSGCKPNRAASKHVQGHMCTQYTKAEHVLMGTAASNEVTIFRHASLSRNDLVPLTQVLCMLSLAYAHHLVCKASKQRRPTPACHNPHVHVIRDSMQSRQAASCACAVYAQHIHSCCCHTVQHAVKLHCCHNCMYRCPWPSGILMAFTAMSDTSLPCALHARARAGEVAHAVQTCMHAWYGPGLRCYGSPYSKQPT
jgi:hypothetical protein